MLQPRTIKNAMASVLPLLLIPALAMVLTAQQPIDQQNEPLQESRDLQMEQQADNPMVAEALRQASEARAQLESGEAGSNLIQSESVKGQPMQDPPTREQIIQRDEQLDARPTSYVDQDVEADVSHTISLQEGETYLGQGVMYDGFNMNGQVPGPTIRVQEGDIVELEVRNDGVHPHGASIHAAYTQTSSHLGDIPSGESRTFKFKASQPGVFLYHCAPGGHAIPMHVIFGQYGTMIVEPADDGPQFKLEEELGHEPDLEIVLNQHEWYASGKDGVDEDPQYVTFNGEIFRYIADPIMAEPGDYVRMYINNIGPNLLSTFHIVGIVWDYAYWQGHPENVRKGGQTVTAGPSDTWVVEFRIPPEEGPYTMLSHAVGSTSKGAIGIIQAEWGAEGPDFVDGSGPKYSDDELAELSEEAKRVISPFKPGTPDVDPPEVYGSETEEVTVRIQGNSFYPKRLEIEEGTKVTWINEDVFTMLQGELSGQHNVVASEGPENFASPMLGHAETFSHTFEEPGEYSYLCTPHPYMQGEVEVVSADDPPAGFGYLMFTLIFAVGAIFASIVAWRKGSSS